MKIVLNSCYGGFGLSDAAMKALGMDYGDVSALARTDSRLVEIVELLGSDAAGDYAELRIVDIPAGTRYRIREYDGQEWLEYETEKYWSDAT